MLENGKQPVATSPWNGEYNLWGHSNTYSLRIMDNQEDDTFFTNPSSQPYANGLPHEEFSEVDPTSYKPNGDVGPSTWGLDVTTGTGTTTSDFTDNISHITSFDDGHTSTSYIADFLQTWYCLELIPPTSSPRDQYVTPNTFGTGTGQHLPQLGEFKSNVSATLLNSHYIYLTHGDDSRSY